MKQLNLEQLKELLKQNNINYFFDDSSKHFFNLADGRVIEVKVFNLSKKSFEERVNPEQCILNYLRNNQHFNFNLRNLRIQRTVSVEKLNYAYKSEQEEGPVRMIDPNTFEPKFIENVYINDCEIIEFFSY